MYWQAACWGTLGYPVRLWQNRGTAETSLRHPVNYSFARLLTILLKDPKPRNNIGQCTSLQIQTRETGVFTTGYFPLATFSSHQLLWAVGGEKITMHEGKTWTGPRNYYKFLDQ